MLITYFVYDLYWNFIKSYYGYSEDEVCAKVKADGIYDCYMIRKGD